MGTKKKFTFKNTEQEAIAHEWMYFRKKFLFSQVMLAETLGISRRAVQYVEAGKVIPIPGTLSKFNALKKKFEAKEM